jgi:hypothetical protein
VSSQARRPAGRARTFRAELPPDAVLPVRKSCASEAQTKNLCSPSYGGGGEQLAIGTPVANAVFHASGVRVRGLR